VSFIQASWYTPRINLIQINPDCSETVRLTSHPGDQPSFTSFVGQEWTAVILDDWVVNGVVSEKAGDRIFVDLAGREDGVWGPEPDGFDPWGLPQCC
jgi:hypothetical protein